MKQYTPRKTFSDLPSELVQRVVFFLDGKASPSSESLHQEPAVNIVKSDEQNLKNISLTCHFLRALVLPSLFKFTTVACGLRNYPQRNEIKALAHFLSDQSQIKVFSVALCFAVVDPSFDMQLLPDDFIQQRCSEAVDEIQPKSLTVVCPSTLLALLAPYSQDTAIEPDDGWAFDMPLHVLHLSTPQADRHLRKGNLWNETWSAITLNEGSSLKVYSTYEYYLKQTPSIFQLNRFCNGVLRAIWAFTVRKFEYVAIFPMSNHVSRVFNRLVSLHSLQILMTRLLPHENSLILSNPDKVGKCSLPDLWMETESSYASIAAFVQHMGENFSLTQFTPLDFARANIVPMLHPRVADCLQGWELHGINWLRTTQC